MTGPPDDGPVLLAVPQAAQIRSLVGVYNAVGTLRGELAYVAAKLSGRAHCALCDITHRGLRHSRAFDEACQSLPVDIELGAGLASAAARHAAHHEHHRQRTREPDKGTVRSRPRSS